MDTANQLGEAPVKTLFFKYYGPALISILSVTLHQVINGIILGRQVGKEGLAAVGLYGPVVTVFIALSLPIMIGGGIMMGKSIGARKYEDSQQIFQFATTLALTAGVSISLMSIFMIGPLAGFLAGKENALVLRSTTDYMLWQLAGIPFFFLIMIWGNFISNDNGPKISRNASVVAVSLNILLDLVFIIGLGWGVKGAAVATFFSMLGSLLYLFFYIQKGKTHFGFDRFRFTLRFGEWKTLLSFGLPSFASEISFSTGLLLINHNIVPYCPLAVSAFGLINYLSFIFLRPLTAAMIAAMPVMSYNIGAGLPHRVLGIFRFAVAFSFGLGLVIAGLGFFIPGLLVKLFSGEESAAFVAMAERATSLYFILFIAAGPNYILSAYLQNIKKVVASTLITVLKGLVLVVTLLLVLPGYFEMGLDGVWLSRSLAEILTLLFMGVYTSFYKGRFYDPAVILAHK